MISIASVVCAGEGVVSGGIGQICAKTESSVGDVICKGGLCGERVVSVCMGNACLRCQL